ncbi:protein kinase [Colletotrichum tofieldiae]|nr:protein kinase [Colletotrichum tofieldiae]GKT74785.1 protein kinase [Colletotrichum tofieldiae]
MSGLELPGLVLGVLGIAIAFKGAIDTAVFIESCFDDLSTDCKYLALSYKVERGRLQLWGQLCKADDDSESILRDTPDDIKRIIVQVLGEIRSLNEKAEVMVIRYNLTTSQLPGLDINDNLYFDASLPRAVSKLSIKPRSRLRWTIKGKAEFEKVVARIRQCITNLDELAMPRAKIRLLTTALPAIVLADASPDMLQSMQDTSSSVDPTLVAAAKTIIVQQRLSEAGANGTASTITNKELQLFAGSSGLGTLFKPNGESVPVWIEWNVLSPGPGTQRYIRLINALGYMLEQVSRPELRLPPCYGIYDDLAYEAENHEKRLGFIFGLPRAVSPSVSYHPNLQYSPPQTLSSLIRDGGKEIPALGDRFHLATVLAIAFSNFHTARWLHKGFHSDNILFFQRTNDLGVTVTEPYITGFQYSRLQSEVSQSRGPLEDKKLEQYYHPQADQGFTKQRDLYGLGVVLCEIGRWKLVADSISRDKRKAMASRELWKEFLLDNVVIDLRWRMGKMYSDVVRVLLEGELPGDDVDGAFFAQEFLQKVIQPLSSCVA